MIATRGGGISGWCRCGVGGRGSSSATRCGGQIVKRDRGHRRTRRTIGRVITIAAAMLTRERRQQDDRLDARILGQIQLVLLFERLWHEPTAQKVILALEIPGAQFGRRQRDERLGLQAATVAAVPVLDVPPGRYVNAADWQLHVFQPL